MNLIKLTNLKKERNNVSFEYKYINFEIRGILPN